MTPTGFWWRSPQSKLTVTTLLIFLSSIWSLAFYANQTLREDIQLLLGEQQLSIVSIIAGEVNDEVQSRLEALESVAGTLTSIIPGDAVDVQKRLESHMIFQRLFNSGIFVTDIDGTAVASVPASIERVGLNFMKMNHIAAALNKGKSFISKPVVGKILSAPVVSIAAPIFDNHGKVIGALVGVTDLGQPNFLDRITNRKFGLNGGFMIVAPQYRLVVTATDKRRVMETLPAIGVNSTLDRMLAGYEGTALFVNPLGTEVMSSAKLIPISGWRAVVTIPTQDAFSPTHEEGQRIRMAAIVLTLLAVTLTWWTSVHQLTLMQSESELKSTTDSLLTVSDELIMANVELAYQRDEKDKWAAKLVVANEEMVFQSAEKIKRSDELVIANVELAYQNDEKDKRAAELVVANEEMAFQSAEKKKRADELVIANVELAYQNDEKDKRAAELVVANDELAKIKKISEEALELSFYEPLTNLANRRLLHDRLGQAMVASKRTGRYVALMMLDLDNFKTLNDLHGHAIGDLLLIEVSRRLLACVREVDTVSRIGGDEFVVVLGELDMDRVSSTKQAGEVAEKVRVSLSQPYLLEELSADSAHKVYEHRCSASIGVVVFVNHEASQDDIFKWADEAMYQSKHAGRNTTRVYKNNGQL